MTCSDPEMNLCIAERLGAADFIVAVQELSKGHTPAGLPTSSATTV